jgi:hypothetical protein
MNFLIIILNRVYLLLTKVKNQSPLLGASILVSLFVGILIENVFLFIYAFKPVALSTSNWIDYILMLIIFLLIYFYARKKKQQVVNHSLVQGIKYNLFVAFVYISTIVSFVFLANINADKILNQNRKEHSTKPKKESLEGRIRKWFDSQ